MLSTSGSAQLLDVACTTLYILTTTLLESKLLLAALTSFSSSLLRWDSDTAWNYCFVIMILIDYVYSSARML